MIIIMPWIHFIFYALLLETKLYISFIYNKKLYFLTGAIYTEPFI